MFLPPAANVTAALAAVVRPATTRCAASLPPLTPHVQARGNTSSSCLVHTHTQRSTNAPAQKNRNLF